MLLVGSVCFQDLQVTFEPKRKELTGHRKKLYFRSFKISALQQILGSLNQEA